MVVVQQLERPLINQLVLGSNPANYWPHLNVPFQLSFILTQGNLILLVYLLYDVKLKNGLIAMLLGKEHSY